MTPGGHSTEKTLDFTMNNEENGTMMKPKVALVKDGFLPAGSENKRGRLSADAIERCKVLVSQGWDIEGYSVSRESSGVTSAEVAKVARVDSSSVSEIPNPTRDESAMTAWVGTKHIGMRTVCNNCRRSLTYCLCPSPKVWVDHNDEGVVHFRLTQGG